MGGGEKSGEGGKKKLGNVRKGTGARAEKSAGERKER